MPRPKNSLWKRTEGPKKITHTSKNDYGAGTIWKKKTKEKADPPLTHSLKSVPDRAMTSGRETFTTFRETFL